jgi:hypothetical protein
MDWVFCLTLLLLMTLKKHFLLSTRSMKPAEDTSSRWNCDVSLRLVVLVWWNRVHVASLGTCLSDFLREAVTEQKANISTLVDVSYATQGQNKNKDMCAVQCYSCKRFGLIIKDCSDKFYNYCKQPGHIVSTCLCGPRFYVAFMINFVWVIGASFVCL